MDDQSRKPYPHLEFAKRLERALDDVPDAPPKYQGRQTWLASKMGVSQEAARKWATGIAIPRMDKIQRIAELLKVDPGWLATGTKPVVPPRDRRHVSAQADAASYLVFAGLLSFGWSCAFNEGEPDGPDITAVKAGRKQELFVASGLEVEPNLYRFEVPKKHHTMRCVGVNIRQFAAADVLDLDPDKVDAVGETEAGWLIVYAEKKGRQYLTGNMVWNVVTAA